MSSGNVLFFADGSGLGFVRIWMDGMVSARVKEIGDRKGQLIIKMSQNMSQRLMSMAADCEIC